MSLSDGLLTGWDTNVQELGTKKTFHNSCSWKWLMFSS